MKRLAAPFLLARDLLATAFALLLAVPLWLLPWRWAAAVGRAYGVALGALWPLARRAGVVNVARAFGAGISRADARRAMWSCFGSLGEGVADGIQFARRFKNGQAGWERICRVEDPDLERRILEDPRPKILVTAHLGSWEMATGIAGIRMGDRGAAIVRRIDNPFLNAVVRRVRLRRASQWIEKKGAASAALARLRQGDSVALLLDENAGPRGVFVDFFGRPASTGKIAALLSLQTGAPLVVGACVRRPGGRFLYRLALVEPLGPPQAPEVAALTQQVVAILERWVRDDPWQWRWVHWRWRTRPDGSEETYTARDVAGCFSRADAGVAGGSARPAPGANDDPRADRLMKPARP